MNTELEIAIYDQLEIYRLEAPENILVEFIAVNKNDLIMCHFGLGMYIRNQYLKSDSRLYNLFIENGIQHKDDMSSIVIRIWHEVLTKDGLQNE